MEMKSKYVIREYRHAEDYPAARSLWENAGEGIQVRESDTPEEIEKKLRRDPDLFLVAEADGKLVGTVIGGFDGRRGLIYHLAVDPKIRNEGVGKKLMQEVEKRLKEKGCLRCYLLVTKENEQAMRFYENLEWTRMESVIIYGKDLK